MEPQRSAVRDILSQEISENSKVKDVEKSIYNLCVRLAKIRGNVKAGDIYNKIAFEKIGHIMQTKDIEKVLNDIENNKVGWESSVFSKQLVVYERMLDRSVLKPTAVKGVYLCKEKGCGSDEFYTWSQQTRSCDEGSTAFRECARCGKRGKQ